MPDTSQMLTLLGTFALAAVLALMGFFLATAVKRWSQREERPETFTFQDLRNMRDRGEITPTEFAAMRSTLLAEHGLGDDGSESEESKPAGPADDTSDD